MIAQTPTRSEKYASLVLTNSDAAKAYEQLGNFYASFIPRPDDPANFDEQESFIENADDGVAWHIGGNGCLAPEQELYDPVDDCYRKIGEIKTPTHLMSRDPTTGQVVVGVADTPFVKGRADLYRVQLSNGQSFVCTLDHKVLSRTALPPFDALEWIPIRDAVAEETLSRTQLHESSVNWEMNHEAEPPLSKKPRLSLTYSGDILGPSPQASMLATAETPAHQQCPERTVHPPGTTASLSPSARAYDYLPPDYPPVDICCCTPVHITSVDLVRQDAEFYDLTVYPHHNYECAGVIHRNSGTTEAAMAKLSRFVLQKQPPPRKDTPFWVIGTSYEQVIESCWKEKLFGHGHIPECEIDTKRITWHDRKKGLPSAVPLRPWPGHDPNHNWMIEFKSCGQGREQMAARAIGGFCFVEQFPYDILTEVLRGMREYNFPGSKFCEFTPIDPAMSLEIEEMIEGDKLPKGWAVYRANTMKNIADPNSVVDSRWGDEFFGMVSEEMRETRMTGAFASYEGVIYQSFNRLVHLTDGFDFPPAVYHKRAIDWGASEEHPFVCLWGFKDALGCWHIYDEYHSKSQDLTSLEHIDEINRRHPWPENSPYHGVTYGDPSRPDQIRLFTRGGIPIVGARNAVDEGIETVRRHLKITPSTGEPLLFINKENCPILARQMITYRWMRSSGIGINPQAARPVPLKKNDDCVDALRYLIHSDYNDGSGGAEGHRLHVVNRLKGQFKRSARR